MAIVSMTKFTLFTYRSDREKVLSLLQKFNDVHFAKQTIQEDFRIENHQKELTALSKDIQNLARVISLLKEETGQGDKELLMRQMSYEELIRKGLSTDLTRLREKVEELWKEREMLRQDVLNFQGQKKELDPWKSLQLPLNELHQAKTMKMRLGTIRGMHRDALMKELEKLNFAYAQVLTSGKSLLNLSIVYLNEESEEVEEVLKKYGFTEVELDGQKTVKEEMQIIDEEISIKQQRISEIHNELMEASKFLSEMELRYEYLRNEESRKKVKEKIHLYFEQQTASKEKNFANGRLVRNLYDDLVMNQAKRVINLVDPSKEDLSWIKAEDVLFSGNEGEAHDSHKGTLHKAFEQQ